MEALENDRMTDAEIADRLGISKWAIRSWCPMSFGRWRDGNRIGLICSFADVKELYMAKRFAMKNKGKQYKVKGKKMRCENV